MLLSQYKDERVVSVSAAGMDGDGARLVDDNHVISVLQDLQGRVLHWHLVSVTITSRSRQPRGNLISLQTQKIPNHVVCFFNICFFCFYTSLANVVIYFNCTNIMCLFLGQIKNIPLLLLHGVRHEKLLPLSMKKKLTLKNENYEFYVIIFPHVFIYLGKMCGWLDHLHVCNEGANSRDYLLACNKEHLITGPPSYCIIT